MKKLYLLFIPLLFISCKPTVSDNVSNDNSTSENESTKETHLEDIENPPYDNWEPLTPQEFDSENLYEKIYSSDYYIKKIENDNNKAFVRINHSYNNAGLSGQFMLVQTFITEREDEICYSVYNYKCKFYNCGIFTLSAEGNGECVNKNISNSTKYIIALPPFNGTYYYILKKGNNNTIKVQFYKPTRIVVNDKVVFRISDELVVEKTLLVSQNYLFFEEWLDGFS